MYDDEAIHVGHCSVFRCVYGAPNCPVVEVEPGTKRGGAEAALTVLADAVDTAHGPGKCVSVEDANRVLAEERAAYESGYEGLLAGMSTEFAVRNTATGWVYALPKILPKFLDGKRGTREAAEWHLRQVGGPDPEDQTGFEIVERPVGPWKVSN